MKLIMFDCDKTLVESYDSTRLFIYVAAYFESLRGRTDLRLAIVSNQGGVGLRQYLKAKGEPFMKYPDSQQAMSRLNDVANEVRKACGIQPLVFAAYNFPLNEGGWAVEHGLGQWAEGWRKPAPLMLFAAMAQAGCLPVDSLMVGDSADDEGAALAAGVRFVWAHEFFGVQD